MIAEVSYPDAEKFQYYLNKNKIKVVKAQYLVNVVFTIDVSTKMREELTNNQPKEFKLLKIELLKQKYIEI